ncbi:hypothetical protein TrLO_g7303 [Triparma laevis f. longispina]|uniref:NADH dehydrogenase [ubiquinone] 1 beta subcomplex subunit 9 n=2 Tax=Triparma laevis TaxID=1534972 RepID=A0A9W7DPN1_9STRA|nr:hypothetical protein TrLO_g7303 [Triparma laevis f. longispina]
MNQAFRLAGDQFRMQAPKLTHKQEVCRLYRNALKLTYSWVVSRDLFLEEAASLRSQFESNRTASPAACTRLMEEAYSKMNEYQHPDKYCNPGMPGGSSFMRNPPLPLSVCFPDGIPDDVNQREVNPDWVTLEEGGYGSGSGQVVVDFTKKNMT